MIRVLKNYNFEILPFQISSDIVNHALAEGEWGIISYDPTGREIVFTCKGNGQTLTPDEAYLAYPIIRGSDWFLKQPSVEAISAIPINSVAVLEKKPGLIIETDKYTGTISSGNKLTVVGVANKGGVLKTAGSGDGIVGICLGVTDLGTIIVRLI